MAGLNETPNADRVRIAFFGRRNAGKSSLINSLSGQNAAIVSDVPGTTTDPVSKAMEILPLGPCLVIDTAGLDDVGKLGNLRKEKSLEVLNACDIAILVIPAGAEKIPEDENVISTCVKRGIALITVRSKSDEVKGFTANGAEIAVSSKTGYGMDNLRKAIQALSSREVEIPLISDLVSPGKIVICVCPIDASAPKGRLILPQQQVVREALEHGIGAVLCQPKDLLRVLGQLEQKDIGLVVTDSQAFQQVEKTLPTEIPLTSFSILFARRKGDLKVFSQGLKAIDSLVDGDTVLVAEGCTHHRQCGDIGSVKIPAWLQKHTGKKLKFIFASGSDFLPDSSEKIKLVVHCGGCMLSRRMVTERLEKCFEAGIPIVNYGILIGYMNGIKLKGDSCIVERTDIIGDKL
jgi:[FeFe] hydrogenase H-cluster maturation GTPase HydF